MAVNTEGKVFRDPIHGHIELDPLLVKIIDTPQFQRLRHIKQLGAKYYVYPGASHNRFEHSIGVCHLAGEMVERLRDKQPKLEITPEEVLCVKIAGLCHDLGHGPFSHVFDGMFIPAAKRRKSKLRDPDPELYPDGVDLNWKHEDGSVDMFDHLVKENGLIEEFEEKKLDKDARQFIKELIQPPKKVLPELSTKWWRNEDKRFLYEIVANDENGIDVDKWDYFERDCYYLGVPNNFDMRRTMTLARVIKVESDGKMHICFNKKESFNLYQMFHTRYCLHKRAYKHPVANNVELMISDALIKAHEGGYRFRFRTGVSLLEAIHDMEAYTRLTDHVVQDIMASTANPQQNPKLRPAQEILERIEKRELYKCVVDKCIPNPSTFHKNEHDIADEIIQIAQSAGSELENGDIRVQVVRIDYGQKEKNPIDLVWFYEKGNPDKETPLEKDEISPILPQCFMEKRIRVYRTSTDKQKDEAIEKCFKKWWSQCFDEWSQPNFSEAGTTQAGPPST